MTTPDALAVVPLLKVTLCPGAVTVTVAGPGLQPVAVTVADPPTTTRVELIEMVGLLRGVVARRLGRQRAHEQGDRCGGEDAERATQ